MRGAESSSSVLRSRPLNERKTMGKEIARSFEKIRSGELLNLKMRGFTNVASLTAAGVTAAKNVGALVYLSTGGTGSVPCLAISDGTNWKQVAIGANAI
jgi:hypothetical protein